MTDANRLAEIEARANAATPWSKEHAWEYDAKAQKVLSLQVDEAGSYFGDGELIANSVLSLDGIFIANAPTDIAYLIAQVKELTARLAVAEELLRRALTLDSYTEVAAYFASVKP